MRFALVDQAGKRHLARAVDDPERHARIPVPPEDRLGHQQLVEIRAIAFRQSCGLGDVAACHAQQLLEVLGVVVAEHALHVLGARVGGDVEVFGAFAEQEIAHRPSHEVGRESRLLQHAIKLEGVWVDNGFVDHGCPFVRRGAGRMQVCAVGRRIPEITSEFSQSRRLAGAPFPILFRSRRFEALLVRVPVPKETGDFWYRLVLPFFSCFCARNGRDLRTRSGFRHMRKGKVAHPVAATYVYTGIIGSSASASRSCNSKDPAE